LLITHKLSSKEWEIYAEAAHLAVFSENRPKEMNRIDFALVVHDGDLPLGYGTFRELDDESVYMQYGGAFPSCAKTMNAWYVYEQVINTLKKSCYKRATTLIENKNIPMLKFAFKMGFKIMGIRFFNNEIYCELLKEFKEA